MSKKQKRRRRKNGSRKRLQTASGPDKQEIAHIHYKLQVSGVQTSSRPLVLIDVVGHSVRHAGGGDPQKRSKTRYGGGPPKMTAKTKTAQGDPRRTKYVHKQPGDPPTAKNINKV